MDKNRKEYIKGLIPRCIRRDRGAWDEFIKLVTPLLTYLIKDKFERCGFYHQKSDIENLRQDILLSIWEKNKLKTIRDKDSAIPWICALTSHAASNYVKALKPSESPKAAPLALDDSLMGPYPQPREELHNKDLREALNSALRSLNHKENLVIKLSLLYGKKYKEISQIMNIPIGSVLACASRAKFKLKRKLKKYEPRTYKNGRGEKNMQ